jgi:hypothetical protein
VSVEDKRSFSLSLSLSPECAKQFRVWSVWLKEIIFVNVKGKDRSACRGEEKFFSRILFYAWKRLKPLPLIMCMRCSKVFLNRREREREIKVRFTD